MIRVLLLWGPPKSRYKGEGGVLLSMGFESFPTNSLHRARYCSLVMWSKLVPAPIEGKRMNIHLEESVMPWVKIFASQLTPSKASPSVLGTTSRNLGGPFPAG